MFYVYKQRDLTYSAISQHVFKTSGSLLAVSTRHRGVVIACACLLAPSIRHTGVVIARGCLLAVNGT